MIVAPLLVSIPLVSPSLASSVQENRNNQFYQELKSEIHHCQNLRAQRERQSCMANIKMQYAQQARNRQVIMREKLKMNDRVKKAIQHRNRLHDEAKNKTGR
jgi:hypothetical protein